MFKIVFIICRLLGVGCRLSGVEVDIRLCLSVVNACCWLSSVDGRVLTVDCRFVGCRCRWLLLEPSYRLSGLVVDCQHRLSLSVCIVGALL